jgi:hypothetical protein
MMRVCRAAFLIAIVPSSNCIESATGVFGAHLSTRVSHKMAGLHIIEQGN